MIFQKCGTGECLLLRGRKEWSEPGPAGRRARSAPPRWSAAWPGRTRRRRLPLLSRGQVGPTRGRGQHLAVFFILGLIYTAYLTRFSVLSEVREASQSRNVCSAEGRLAGAERRVMRCGAPGRDHRSVPPRLRTGEGWRFRVPSSAFILFPPAVQPRRSPPPECRTKGITHSRRLPHQHSWRRPPPPA